jgi:predicted membrane-bound dolichyl-phosphate-mannose-protein mannosyltransferase
MKIFQTLNLFIIISCFSFNALAQNKHITEYPREGNFYQMPALDVQVELTKQAEEQLHKFNERILIAFYFTTNPEDLGERKEQFSYEENLLQMIKQKSLIIAPKSGVAYLNTWAIPVEENKKFDPYLNINVISARDHCSNNILNCSLYDDKYPSVKRTVISIKCDIIAQPAMCD